MAKNTPDLTSMLRPGDRQILEETADISWVPKVPTDLLLPYMSEDESEPDRTDVDHRRQKAKEVFDGYGKIIERCKEIEDRIETECKNVKVTLNPTNNLRVMEAIRRVFGTDGQEITFAMYKACVKALAEKSGSNIPKPTDKEQ